MKNNIKKKTGWSVLLGAAFLMATSAVGPGFLTQTSEYTQRLGASFAFVILISIILDIGAQLNIWRIIVVSKKYAQEIADEVLPGLGLVLAIAVALGGLAFNIGNIGGAGLGVNVLFPKITPIEGGIISAIVAIVIFISRNAGKLIDAVTVVLGLGLLLMILYIVFTSAPPFAEAAYRMVWPEHIDVVAIVTLVGGTVGGYITFAGAHRLIDAGTKGKEALPEVNKSAITAISLASLVRILLFFAALGVVSLGFTLDSSNPAASVFEHAAGTVGYKIFGLVLWSAALTSIIGSAYTSVTFLKTLHPLIDQYQNVVIIAFIVFSCLIFSLIGKPAMILLVVGTINGFILPVTLGAMLVAAHNKKIIGEAYKHSKFLSVFGWFIVIIMGVLSLHTLARICLSYID